MARRAWQWLVLPMILCVGCTRVSTGIEPAGASDTYEVTERNSPLGGGAHQAEQTATAEADEYCHAMGRAFLPVTAQVLGRDWQRPLVGDTGVRLTFRCQARDAPDDAATDASFQNERDPPPSLR